MIQQIQRQTIFFPPVLAGGFLLENQKLVTSYHIRTYSKGGAPIVVTLYYITTYEYPPLWLLTIIIYSV